MILRFCLYSILKNLRFADPFLVLYLVHRELSLAEVGLLMGLSKLVSATLELPLGVVADGFGRRRSLAACFACYSAAFVLYPLSAQQVGGGGMSLLSAAAVLYGLGEALRSGSHKAIILDWLDTRGESARATEVIGLARSFSKFSRGGSALVGGLILVWFQSWSLLFWMSAATALGGFVLMLSYPRDLEGEQTRDRRGGSSGRVPWRQRLRDLAGAPGTARLVAQSVLFDGQLMLLFKVHVQVFLAAGLAGLGVPVQLASGALAGGSGPAWMGASECLRDSLGGIAARLSGPLERRMGGAHQALDRVFLLAVLGCLVLAVSAYFSESLFLVGLAVLFALTILFDARKPIFVSALNRRMDKAQRATTLSLHSQFVSMGGALLLPLTGWVADTWGLAAVFASLALLMLPGLLLRVAALDDGPTGDAAPDS